jgi:hypothetical protein
VLGRQVQNSSGGSRGRRWAAAKIVEGRKDGKDGKDAKEGKDGKPITGSDDALLFRATRHLA